MRLIRSWYTPAILFFVVFTLFWDLFLVVWYVMAIFVPSEDGKLIMVFFPVMHVLAGIGLTWYTLACLFNKTTVDISRYHIRVRHGPIPWWSKRHLQRKDILEVELEYTGVSDDATGRHMAGSAHHADSRKVVLLKSLPREHAMCLAWQIAHALKVPLKRLDEPDRKEAKMPKWLQRWFPLSLPR